MKINIAVCFGFSTLELLSDFKRKVVHCLQVDEVEVCFTSGCMKKRIKKQGVSVHSLSESFEYYSGKGVDHITVQSFHIIPGKEFLLEVVKTVRQYKERFQFIFIGNPLLFTKDDALQTAQVMVKHINNTGKNIPAVLVGHGVTGKEDYYFQRFKQILQAQSANIIFCTVEGTDDFFSAVQELQSRQFSAVKVFPFFLNTSYHWDKDINGDSLSSLKTKLINAGIRPAFYNLSLLDLFEIGEIFFRHYKNN